MNLIPSWRIVPVAHVFKSLKIIVLDFAIAVVFLLLFEIFIRLSFPEIHPLGTDRALIIDPRYGSSPGLRPEATGVSDGIQFHVDELGFWSYDSASDSSAQGWLLLGDSVTMGMGVEPDSTFAGRLAISNRNHRILNASWIGYSSSDYVNVALALLLEPRMSAKRLVHVEHVTVFWCLNDVYSDIGPGGHPGDVIRQSGASVLAFLQSNSRTYQWLRNLIFDRPATYFENDLQYYAAPSKQWSSAERDLHTLRDICSRAGVLLDVVVLPYLVQLRHRSESDFVPQRVLTEYLRELGIACYDPTSFIFTLKVDPNKFYRFGDGIHFSKLGHRIVFEFLKNNLDPPLTHPRVVYR
jgi:lysophospholipase L1-like esterase